MQWQVIAKPAAIKMMFSVTLFLDLLWYLKIKCDFHFSCFTSSSTGLKGQIMPSVTHLQLYILHTLSLPL